jgi:hypothetical protein
MNRRARSFARSSARAASSGSIRSVREVAALLARTGLVFVCVYLAPLLCFRAGEGIGALVAGGYEFDTWFNSWAAWFTWLGAVLLAPLAVGFLTIAAGGGRWLASVALALLPYTSVQIWLASDSPFFYNTPVPPGAGLFWSSLWWAVPIASSLLCAVGAGLGLAWRRRRDKRLQQG